MSGREKWVRAVSLSFLLTSAGILRKQHMYKVFQQNVFNFEAKFSQPVSFILQIFTFVNLQNVYLPLI